MDNNIKKKPGPGQLKQRKGMVEKLKEQEKIEKKGYLSMIDLLVMLRYILTVCIMPA